MKIATVRNVSWSMEDDVYEWHTRKDSMEIGPNSCWEWHPTVGQELESFKYLCESRKPRVFIDIGAHCGIFSSVYCSLVKDHDCYSIEPIESHTSRLERTAKLNNWNLKSLQMALNNYVGNTYYHNSHMAMFVDDKNYKVPEEYMNGKEENSVVKGVEVNTLDNFVLKRGLRPDLIKIDVEGYEIPILEKGQHCISEYNTDLFIEFHREESLRLGLNISKLIEYVPKNKYNFYTYDFNYEISDLLDYITNYESNIRFVAINKNNKIQ